MDPTRTNTRESSAPVNPDLEAAERRVDRDIERFNSAVESLADKVDATSRDVQSTVYKIRHPGETLKNAGLRARDAFLMKARPTYDHYKARSYHYASRASESVRRNRGPIALVAIAFAGAWITSALFTRRQNRVIVRRSVRRPVSSPPAVLAR